MAITSDGCCRRASFHPPHRDTFSLIGNENAYRLASDLRWRRCDSAQTTPSVTTISSGDLCVCFGGAHCGCAVVVLFGYGAMSVMEKRASEVRVITSMDSR